MGWAEHWVHYFLKELLNICPYQKILEYKERNEQLFIGDGAVEAEGILRNGGKTRR